MKDLNLQPIVCGIYNNNSIIYNTVNQSYVNFKLMEKYFLNFIPTLIYQPEFYVEKDFNESQDTICSVNLIINKTTRPIVFRDTSNIPKIVNPHNKEYTSEVYVITIHTLKNPFKNKQNTLEKNYITDLLNRYENYIGQTYSELKEILRFVLNSHEELEKFESCNNGKFTSLYVDKLEINKKRNDYLHVITAIRIPENILIDNKTIYISNKAILLSIKNIDEVEEHPITVNDNPFSSPKYLEQIDKNLISFILVDNHNKLNQKYVYIFNKAIKVDTIKDVHMPDGLYITSKINNEAKTVHYTFEKCKELNLLFDTEEEAINNMDINKIIEREKREMDIMKTKYNLEIEELKKQNIIEQNNFNIAKKEIEMKTESIKNELLKERTENEKELLRLKSELEKQRSAINIDHESKMSSIKEKNYNDKFLYEYNNMLRDSYFEARKLYTKDFYDHRSYERNETLETIKTIGAVVGVLATMYIVSKKI